MTERGVGPASVHVRGGRIVAVSGFRDVPRGCPLDDHGDAVVMPGLVDTHVHVNDPGRAEWEGFETATRAAAAGGVTTIVDMPLNSIPATTSVGALEAKAAAAEGRIHVDVGLAGGVVPGNVAEVRRLRAAGALAFKCFLAPSGVDEFPHVGEDDLRVALPALADGGAPLLVHAEHPARLREAAPSRRYADWLAARPPEAEDDAVALVARLCADFGARAHIVHLSSAGALATIRRAREAGVALTAETCPHYLWFAAEEVPDGATAYKCAPPIRERANRDRLWSALREGLVDQIVTDHSPSTPALKCVESGDFAAAWGGIASLQLGLAVVWTAARARGASPADVARWMCAAPARLVGLGDRKGAIAPGRDADFCVWRPEAAFRVDAARLHHRHKLTPYAGSALFGAVEATYLRGVRIYHRGRFAPPSGRLVWA
ncbi:MAG: allantoinase AllB [Myxococcota bacterium]